MGVSLRAALIAASLAAAPTSRALDFRLSAVLVEEDGFKHEQLFFRDNESSVYISLPTGWERVPEPASLTLSSPAETNTMVRLERSPFAPDLPFKDKSLETYRQRVLGTIPQGATEAQVEEREDPLPIFHWKSHEFVVDYVFFGQTFRRSVVFVDLNAREQIMVTTVAPKLGYDRARSVAFDVLRSWQVMPVQ